MNSDTIYLTALAVVISVILLTVIFIDFKKAPKSYEVTDEHGRYVHTEMVYNGYIWIRRQKAY